MTELGQDLNISGSQNYQAGGDIIYNVNIDGIDPEKHAKALVEIERLKILLTEMQDKIESAEEVVSIANSLTNDGAQFDPWDDITFGDAARLAGQEENAMKLYERANDGFQQQNDQLGVAIFLKKKSLLTKQLGKTEIALPLQEEALQIVMELENEEEILHIQGNIAMLHFRLKNYDAAEEIWKEVLARAEQNEYITGILVGKEGLARISKLRGDIDAANRFYKESVELSVKLNQSGLERKEDIRNRCVVQMNYAFFKRECEEFETSEKLYKRSLEIARDLGFSSAIEKCRRGLEIIAEKNNHLSGSNDLELK